VLLVLLTASLFMQPPTESSRASAPVGRTDSASNPAPGTATPSQPASASANPTQIENQRAGSVDWEITQPAIDREIEGYASRTSVDAGETIDLFVNTAAPRYTIDVFRMGWYSGLGARRLAGPIERTGTAQAMPAPDPSTGLVECHWRDPYALRTRDANGAWPSGVYLARLTAAAPAAEARKQAFIVFVVRDDRRASAIVFQSSVTTYAAYNNWGGRSLYGFNSGGAPARKVSFDRPYAMKPYGARLDGAGDFLRRWEYNAVRFLERDGYDVSYITDVDTHERGGALLHHRIFLVAGDDAYWSRAMREHVEAARDHGVHLAFLGAGACFWQIRFEANSSGDADRTIVAYKEAAGALDPLALDRDPAQHRLITGRWRDRPVSRPEDRLIGIMYADDPVNADIVVDDAAHWVFANTGLKRGDALIGLLGNVVDAVQRATPLNVERLAHSPYPDPRMPSRIKYADMTIYRAASGAFVFATGSNQWSWGLDDYNARPTRKAQVSRAAQQMTRNVLNRMLQGRGAPVRSSALPRPSLIVIVACAIAVVVVVRAWLLGPTMQG
jgi:hypothetical protein